MLAPEALTGAPHFEAFARTFIRQTKGRWAGKPLEFEWWQREFLREALELDPATGLRVFREVGLGLPRKNGKSTLSSAAGLYFLTADGEAEPEIYVGAASRGQAGVVLSQSRSMVLRSGPLQRFVLARKFAIECPRNGGIMRAVASDGALQHGLNPSANIIDELHAHKDDSLWTALTSGTGAREQPFTFWISTAGANEDGILGTLFNSMFSGAGELEQRFGGALTIFRDRENGVLIWWFGAPKSAAVDDPEVWRTVNPASWLQDLKFIGGEFRKLSGRGRLVDFRHFHLNQFWSGAAEWLPEGAWDRCLDASADLDHSLPIGVGVFKAPAHAAAAVVVAQKQGDRFVIRHKLFGPDPITERVSTIAIKDHLRELRAEFPMPQMRDPKTRRRLHGPAIAFEEWQLGDVAGELTIEGLNMVEADQVASVMGPASENAFVAINEGRVAHNGDLALATHISNAIPATTDRGVRLVSPKGATKRPSHGSNALVMAIAMASHKPPPPPEPAVFGGFS